jgi:hypothetical protein
MAVTAKATTMTKSTKEATGETWSKRNGDSARLSTT